jgi:hypothetical protein
MRWWIAIVLTVAGCGFLIPGTSKDEAIARAVSEVPVALTAS